MDIFALVLLTTSEVELCECCLVQLTAFEAVLCEECLS